MRLLCLTLSLFLYSCSFFDMEVIAGENNFITAVKEHDCKFQMDFSKVYWNSRLETEHRRIVRTLAPVGTSQSVHLFPDDVVACLFSAPISCSFDQSDIVVDAFAGIGPFVVPAAKKRVTCYANDLNPESVRWLKVNVEANKAAGAMAGIENMDARDFIRSVWPPITQRGLGVSPARCPNEASDSAC